MRKKPKKPRKDKTAGLHFEYEYHPLHQHIFGVDEVGRGPWAGPIVAGAVCLPLEDTKLKRKLKGVRDSKDMTENQREALVSAIQDVALSWGIGVVSAEEISMIGIKPANQEACERALAEAQKSYPNVPVDYVFMDYMAWASEAYPRQLTITGGDRKSLSIASASILAKVWRDNYMRDIAEEFPQYGFERHKGYGTAQHRKALEQYGITPLHRTNFAPIQALLQK
jgi:ribonuclease HII